MLRFRSNTNTLQHHCVVNLCRRLILAAKFWWRCGVCDFNCSCSLTPSQTFIYPRKLYCAIDNRPTTPCQWTKLQHSITTARRFAGIFSASEASVACTRLPMGSSAFSLSDEATVVEASQPPNRRSSQPSPTVSNRGSPPRITVRPRVIYLRRPTAAASRDEPYTRYQPRYFQPQPLQRSTQPSPVPRWVRRHCTACGRLLQINSTTHQPFQRIDHSSDPPRHPTESLPDPYDRPVQKTHKGRPVPTPVTSHIQPDRRLSLWFMSVIFSVFLCAYMR